MSTDKRTRNPRIWGQYLCWKIDFWMGSHKPYLPVRLRRFILDRFPENRHHVSPKQYESWLQVSRNPACVPKPLPRIIGCSAEGPFLGPWMRVQRFFGNHTGGRSHRCEFTDKQHGALYGHNEGAFMDRYFDEFIANIEAMDD